jgi:hypothetical protein
MTDEQELIRYEFTQEELTDKAREIAIKISEGEDLDREKKSVAADYASKEKRLALDIRDLSRLITDGRENRRTACHCFKDFESGYAYYYTDEQMADYDINNVLDIYDTVELMVQAFLDSSLPVKWVKKRSLRDNERQGDLFDAAPEGDQSGPDEVVTVDELIDGEVVDADFDQRMDDKALQVLLATVLKVKPNLKTIKLFTDAECAQAHIWATAYNLSKTEEVVVPVIPDFLGVPQ